MTRLQVAAPLLAAAALAAVAVATVSGAGCDDPSRYVPVAGGGYELVGGCVTAGDVMLPEPEPAAPAVIGSGGESAAPAAGSEKPVLDRG